jgi:hypothetical protein
VNKQTRYFIAAFVVALPALILLANLCAFAFVGAGFLPAGTGFEMNYARLFIAIISSTGAVAICGMGATA